MEAASPVVRASAVVVLLGVAVEAAAAAVVAITPLGARWFGSGTWAWAPFVVAVIALAVAGSPLGRSSAAAAALGLVGALSLGLGMAAVGAGALAGTGLAFATALLVGEVIAAGVYVAGAGEVVATGASLFVCALATSLLVIFGDRLDLAILPGGVAVGGAVAALQIAGARYADGAVAHRFTATETVPAAVARLTEVPRRLILAVLGTERV
jgi:hypothetical protein